MLVPWIVGYLIWRLFTKGRSNKKFVENTSVVVQYEPPEELTAAEVGLLIDSKAGRLEVLATIYDLKRRGALAISSAQAGPIQLKLLKYEKSDLADYEDMLLRCFFREQKEIVLAEQFEDPDFAVVLCYFQYKVMQTLQSKGLLHVNADYATQTYESFIQRVEESPVNYVFNTLIFGVRKYLTDKAKGLMPELEGFKEYIETAKLDKIKFHAPGDVEGYMERLTPYAIALGQMERWRMIGIPAVFVHDGNHEHLALINKPNPQPADFTQNTLEAIKRLDAYVVAD